MTNKIDEFGLQVNTLLEQIENFNTGFKAIYGNDINLEQSTPDGQQINILSQSIIDVLELLVSVYNSFDADSVVGILQDLRYALNGLTRKGATYTFTPVNVTTDRALNLTGLDSDIDNPDGTGFTVADDEGNQFILAASQVIASAGTYAFSFRAKEIGEVQTLQNTITNIITIVQGVTSVNNPNVATVTGQDGESDSDFKIRRSKSFYLQNVGQAESLLAALLANTSITDAFVYDNDTNGTVDTVPAHSIWAIVEGGTDEEIGNIIIEKKSAGVGMKGDEEVIISQPQNNSITIKFDRPLYTNLYIKFSLTPRIAGVTFDNDFIKTELVIALSNYYKLNQSAIATDIVPFILEIQPDAIVTDIEVSDDDITYTDILNTDSAQYKFLVSASRITII